MDSVVLWINSARHLLQNWSYVSCLIASSKVLCFSCWHNTLNIFSIRLIPRDPAPWENILQSKYSHTSLATFQLSQRSLSCCHNPTCISNPHFENFHHYICFNACFPRLHRLFQENCFWWIEQIILLLLPTDIVCKEQLYHQQVPQKIIYFTSIAFSCIC